ncbi:UNVERIFIED_CONTAM: hypothetical protein FKN15_060320 [Acipenser sinensis]
MPWPFSESIKKRACRYLLHRYLGNFLQEKLSLDQFSLDLYQGTGSLAQVPLDKWSLNEILESVDAPFEVIEGFIQTISLSVPWASLLQENCALEVKGLEMVFRPRPRMASGSEPMYWSSFMTSSMQLAKECLSQRLTDELAEGFQPLEGLEKFAETIETVLRRVKVTFLDTVLRIEHVPENSKTGIALEMRISKIVYCDETGDECSGMNVHQPTMFAHKNLQLTGVSVFWDEFSEAARTCPKSSTPQTETEPKLSPSWNPKIICEPHPQFTRTVSEVAPFKPVQIGSLNGRMELGLILKQNEALPGAKLDVDGRIDSINVLLSPRQVHLLLDMLGVFSGPESSERTSLSCKDRKSRPIQQEDEYRLHMELHRCLKKDTLAAGGLEEQGLFESETRTTSSRAHPSKSHSVDESRPEVVFRLALGCLSVSVLHIDPLPPPETALNLNPLTLMASDFFSRIEKINPAELCKGDFPHFHPIFDEACPYDHLRFMGTGIRVTYEQRQSSSLRSLSTDVSVGQMELLECLFPTDSRSSAPQYTELVTFDSDCLKESHPPACLHLLYKFSERRGPQGSQVRLSSMPQKADFQIELGPVHSELDITIVDRLNSLLQPQKLATTEMMASHMYTSYNKHVSLQLFAKDLTGCFLCRPLYLPIRSLLTVETFSISSNVSLDRSSSTLRIILDEAALFLSDKCNTVSVNLNRADYVQVVDMGLLELRITAVKPGVNGEMTEPRFELRCSSDVIHIRTCYDSCAALMNLIQYIASYGDLIPPPRPETKAGGSKQRGRPDIPSRPPSRPLLLPEAEQQILQDLMSEAMEDTDFHQARSPEDRQPNGVHEGFTQALEPPRSDLFLFPDESGNISQEPSPTFTPYHHPLIYAAMSDAAPESDDFCILETPLAGAADRDEEPVVNKLTSDSIEIQENHFSLPLGRTDSNKGPLHFPVPEIRYLIKEISIIWHLYGGKDFAGGPVLSSPAKSRGCTPHSSPSQTPVRQSRVAGRAHGGRGRNPDVLMEIQLSKVKFQHEVYPQSGADREPSLTEQPVSRQVFIVQDLEIRDRLATSQMNKFLYLYFSKEMPRKAHSNMLTVKALHVCPESGRAPQECCLRVSLMPLRLNIDQDALFFLKDFFASIAAEVELLSPPDQEVKKPPAPDHTCSFPKHMSGSLDPAPIISVPGQGRPSQNGLPGSSSTENGEAEPSPASNYHGKHVSMEQGTFAGIVIGLTQLNCSELKLKRLCYRQGLLGVDKLFSYAISEWLNDIKKNQLPGILGGVGPIHSLVQLVKGLSDLVWLPIEQYRKDGRIVRGFQRGAASFGTSTAMAALELTNRMVQTIQAAAETAYDMVSPGPDESELKRIKRFSHYRLAHQPVDLREGVAKAYSVVKEGITDTALTIYDTATREHEQRGVTGAVGGVLRQIPPAVVKPLIVATEATSNVLGGMRNQIRPDARQEESQKWRLGEE